VQEPTAATHHTPPKARLRLLLVVVSFSFSFQFFTRLAAVCTEEVTQPPSRGRTISGDRGLSLHQTESRLLSRCRS
jgi:hypothetical protein